MYFEFCFFKKEILRFQFQVTAATTLISVIMENALTIYKPATDTIIVVTVVTNATVVSLG